MLHPEFKCIDINEEYRYTSAKELGKQLRPFIDSFFGNSIDSSATSSNESTIKRHSITNGYDTNSITNESSFTRAKNSCNNVCDNNCIINNISVNCNSISKRNSIIENETTNNTTNNKNNNTNSTSNYNNGNVINNSKNTINKAAATNNTDINALLIKNLAIRSASDFHDFIAGCDYEKMVYTNGSGFREPLNELVYTASDEPAVFTIEPHNEMSYLDTFPSKVYNTSIS